MTMAKDTGVLMGDVFVQGGLINDADVTIKEAIYTMFDYGGGPVEVCASKLVLVDNEGDEHEQHWSVGGNKEGDFVPANGGKAVKSLTGRTALNTGSNHQMLIASLIKCGMPEGWLGADITQLKGLKGHVLRVPGRRITREGDTKKEGGRDPEVLTFSEVTKAPWDSKGRKGGSAKAKTGDTDETDAFDTEVAKLVIKVLSEADEPMSLDELGMEVFAAADGVLSKSERKRIVPTLDDGEYVSAIKGVKVEDGNASV